ncbi:MAG: hypothetical protein A2033_02015 [Bacteroidetes bacterium GWA2_31_9]|nr:MAG: hypothetical protein A2033_02015 [Bacteroidetes bacterium GWA2_31_9]
MENKTVEILKMAILMERRGRAFYAQVAEQTKSPEVKEVFNIMAEEEIMHEKILAEEFKNYSKSQNFVALNLPEDNYNQIAKLILNKDLKNKISSASFEAAAISAAIDMETKAIEVYAERAKTATDDNEKKLYQWLSEWEKGHHKILLDLDNELKEKIWFDNQFWPF